jgi:hypothetical protein
MNRLRQRLGKNQIAKTQRMLLFLLMVAGVPAYGSEDDALRISNNIQAFHMPYGVIMDPVFATPTSKEIVGYSRAGNSAIWTGHYLAAEAVRYRVTGSPEALNNLRRALSGIRSLVEITGSDVLARTLVPIDSPYADGILVEEGGHGTFTGTLGDKTYHWIGNTKRDEYVGVFFGLGVAYDGVEDPDVRSSIRDVVTRLLDFLLRNNWAVIMPNGQISTVFWGRPDQQLSFLQVGRRVNPSRFDSAYKSYRFWYASAVITPTAYDLADVHTSYFKFNLNTITLYSLIRLEDSSFYRWVYLNAYNVMRRTTDDHGNAHFNMIDRALKEPDSRRDSETRSLLEDWLSRPTRDEWVDWRGDPRYPACGEDRACNPIPVVDRVRTDFLWQRSPFLLYGGGQGTIEGPGIDYILPYWMARYYGVL